MATKVKCRDKNCDREFENPHGESMHYMRAHAKTWGHSRKKHAAVIHAHRPLAGIASRAAKPRLYDQLLGVFQSEPSKTQWSTQDMIESLRVAHRLKDDDKILRNRIAMAVRSKTNDRIHRVGRGIYSTATAAAKPRRGRPRKGNIQETIDSNNSCLSPEARIEVLRLHAVRQSEIIMKLNEVVALAASPLPE